MILVLSTVASEKDARKIARTLVEERLAACGTVVPGATSVYRWEGKVEENGESLLLLKARKEDWIPLRDRLSSLHPYDTPEIVSIPASGVSEKYAAWMRAQTSR